MPKIQPRVIEIFDWSDLCSELEQATDFTEEELEQLLGLENELDWFANSMPPDMEYLEDIITDITGVPSRDIVYVDFYE